MLKRWLALMIFAGVGALNAGTLIADVSTGGHAEWVEPTTVAVHVALVDASLPECVTEDSVSCVWHGARHGNGTGWTVVNGPEQH